MPDKKLFDSAQASHLSGLAGSAMECLGSTCRLALGKGGFVKEQIGPLNILHVIGIEAGIATIHIFAWRSGRQGKPAIRNDLPIRSGVILAILDTVDHAERYLIEVYHLALDVSCCWLLLKHEAATGNTVAQRKCLYAYRAVLIDNIGAAMRKRMKRHIIGHAFAKIVELRTQQFLQLREGVNVQCGRAPQQAKGGDKSYQTKAMVAMEVRDEDMVEPRETELCPPVLLLRAFATVNHKELIAQIDNLR